MLDRSSIVLTGVAEDLHYAGTVDADAFEEFEAMVDEVALVAWKVG